MNRRIVLKAMTSGLALASEQFLLRKGSAQAITGSPGLLTVHRGSHISISILRSDQSPKTPLSNLLRLVSLRPQALSAKFREKNPLGQADPHLNRTVFVS
jgi:hypothetical protein